jgi:hypothetical protein
LVNVDTSWLDIFDQVPDAEIVVRPGENIQTAITAAQRSVGSTRLIIEPGLYRQMATVQSVRSPESFIKIECEGVTISGSDVFGGLWRQDGDVYVTDWSGMDSNIYPNGWPTTGAGAPANMEMLLARELVFDGGERLRQVLSRESMEEGTYYSDGERLYVWPLDDVDLMEVATRSTGLRIINSANVSAQGLTIQHTTPSSTATFSGLMATAFPINNSHHVLLNGITSRENNTQGISFWQVPHVVCQDIAVESSGLQGLGVGKVSDAVFEGVTLEGCNWRGLASGFIGWQGGGTKFLKVHRTILQDIKCSNIGGRGIWFDTDISDTLVENLHCDNCVNDLFMFEHVQGPVELRNARLWGGDRYGLVTRNTEQMTLRNVHILDNNLGGLVVSGSGYEFPDFETNQVYNTSPGVNWTLEGVFLHGKSPLFKADGEYPNQGIDGTWEDLPGLVNRGVYFFGE